MQKGYNRVKLQKGGGEDALGALQRWYYNPTLSEERTGNIPSLDFTINVRCIEHSSSSSSSSVVVDVRTLHPQRDALILIYTFRKAYGGEVMILSTIPYHVMRFTLRGVVTTQDMTQYGCSRVASISDLRIHVGAGGGGEPNAWKWGILFGDAMEITLTSAALLDESPLLQEFCQRLQWYYSNNAAGTFPSHSEHEKQIWILCSVFAGALEFGVLACHPHPDLDSRAARVHYDERRLERERLRFMDAMSHYQHHSEAAFLRLFHHNCLRHAIDPMNGGWKLITPNGPT